MLATIVDWAALGKVVLYSFAATILLTALFTTGVLAVGDGRHRSGVVSVLAFARAWGCSPSGSMSCSRRSSRMFAPRRSRIRRGQPNVQPEGEG